MDLSQWPEALEQDACISHIFSQASNDRALDAQDGIIEVLQVSENYVKIKPFAEQGRPVGSGAVRGDITSFTKGSRARMIQAMASLEKYPSFWQDFTFADDVMESKTVSERAEFSSQVLKEFKREAFSLYPKLWGKWRREWEPRKSGSLKGQHCPHFHMLLDMPGITEQNYRKVCLTLAVVWVRLTGTSNPNAFKVAINGKSYRFLDNPKMAQVYVSKYVAKEENYARSRDEKRGRFHGNIGKPPKAPMAEIKLSEAESVVFRRLFRGKVGNQKKLRKILSTRGRGVYLLVNRQTVLRMLDYVIDAVDEQMSFPAIN